MPKAPCPILQTEDGSALNTVLTTLVNRLNLIPNQNCKNEGCTRDPGSNPVDVGEILVVKQNPAA